MRTDLKTIFDGGYGVKLEVEDVDGHGPLFITCEEHEVYQHEVDFESIRAIAAAFQSSEHALPLLKAILKHAEDYL